MRILLYNPDNGVTRNLMPHLWMFLLRSLTRSGHEVLLIDGNAQPMDEAGIARFVQEENIGLVGVLFGVDPCEVCSDVHETRYIVVGVIDGV